MRWYEERERDKQHGLEGIKKVSVKKGKGERGEENRPLFLSHKHKHTHTLTLMKATHARLVFCLTLLVNLV